MKRFLAFILAMVLFINIVPFGSVSADKTSKYKEFIKYRGQDLKNTYAKLKAGEEVNVVYYGGSVTEGMGLANAEKDSWRGRIGKWLADNFKDAKINNINASFSGTGTKMGSYRLNPHVISQKPDLVFVEFAINDHYDDQSEDVDLSEYSMRFETIVRNIRTELPKCDIITVLTTEKCYLNTNLAGELHNHAQEHEKICEKYDIPSIHVGRALSEAVGYNGSWDTYMRDVVHPNENGHALYYNVIKEYMSNCLLYGKYDGTAKKHTVPQMVNEYLLDGDIKIIDVDQDLVTKSKLLGGQGFKYYNGLDIAQQIKVFGPDGTIPENYDQTMIFALEFTGTEIAIIDYCHQTVTIEAFKVSIDGGAEKTVAHQIEPTVLAADLKYGKHKITIKPVFKTPDTRVCWIKAFLVRNQNKQTAKYDHEHRYDKYVSNKDATCKKDGTKTAKCYKYKSGCDMTDTIADVGSKKAHKFVVDVTEKATITNDGKGEKVCELCGRTESLVTIGKIKTVKLSTTSYTYNGKAKKPKVIVKDANGKTISDEYYKITRSSSSKKVGKYTIKVKFKTKYSGTVKLTYKINPAKSGVSKVTAAKKSLKVKIKKVSSQATGYEIQYSTSKKFTKSTTKTKTIKSYKTTSVTIKSLKAKKTYYVRVRTYKTVDGKKYYSDWSSYKSKKTK